LHQRKSWRANIKSRDGVLPARIAYEQGAKGTMGLRGQRWSRWMRLGVEGPGSSPIVLCISAPGATMMSVRSKMKSMVLEIHRAAGQPGGPRIKEWDRALGRRQARMPSDSTSRLWPVRRARRRFPTASR
jgi:hypothetical protein